VNRDNIQQLLLCAGVAGWGISILGVLLPWPLMDAILQNMGAMHPVGDPQLRYWFRMATASWTMISMFYAAALFRPQKYGNLLPLLALGSLFEGVVLLIHGWSLNLPPFPFYGDVLFTLGIGGGLLWTQYR